MPPSFINLFNLSYYIIRIKWYFSIISCKGKFYLLCLNMNNTPIEKNCQLNRRIPLFFKCVFLLSNVQLSEAKLYDALLKDYFLTKVDEIWKHDYWRENALNDAFHFSDNIIELEFQKMGWLICHFFITLVWKLVIIFIFILYSQKSCHFIAPHSKK